MSLTGRLLIYAAAFCAAVAWRSAASAQEELRSIKRLQCAFSTYATVNWVDGSARAEIKESKLSLQFEAIDVDGGTADTVAPSGRMHITVRLSESAAHFMQIGTSGALNLTTVFAPDRRNPLPSGRLRAVHTRHEYTEVSLPGFTSRPEQYYGDCGVN